MPRFPWHLHRLEIKEAWKESRGEGVEVAILDSGAWKTTGINDSRVRHFKTDGTVNADPYDRSLDAHGTQVTGIIVSNDDGFPGLAPAARASSYEISDPKGHAIGEAAAIALVAAVRAGVDIVCTPWTLRRIPPELLAALEQARAAGVLVVAAGGNVAGPRDYPRNANVIAVAASDNHDFIRSPTNDSKWIKIAAPGFDIQIHARTRVNGFTGTSAAAPVVAGGLALALSLARRRGAACEQWFKAQASDLLQQTGTRLQGRSNCILNVRALIETIKTQGPSS